MGHVGNIFLSDWQLVLLCHQLLQKRCVHHGEEKNKRKKKIFSSINSHDALPNLNWIKLMSSWRKDWWILWTDFKVNDKDVNYDILSYPKQKQVRKKAYRAGGKPTKHKKKEDPKCGHRILHSRCGIQKDPGTRKALYYIFICSHIWNGHCVQGNSHLGNQVLCLGWSFLV